MNVPLEEHAHYVYRFALRLTRDGHVAEEITQETFVRACPRQHRLREPRAARVWLLRIALNLWRDRLRRRERQPDRADVPLDERPSEWILPEQELIEREDVQRAIETMDALPPRQREVLFLHACEQLSPTEIAEILDIAPDAVKASLSLARKKMRQQLRDVCEDRFPQG